MQSDVHAAICEELVKIYRQKTGEVRALNGIDVAFPSAVLSAVVGPSGSGKSSLLRLLAAIDRPTTGHVTVGGARIDAASGTGLRHVRRGTVGYVFQRPSDNFVSYLTVGEHLRMARGRAGSGAGAADGLDPGELLEGLGIAPRVDHLPSELSGGEQQRAAIAQILLAGPRIVVADEPTAELDSASARDVLEIVHRLVEFGITFIIATHDPNVTERADHVVELEHGLVRRGGRRRASAESYRLHFARPPRPYERTAGTRGVDAPVASVTNVGAQTLMEAEGLVKEYRRGDETVHALQGVDISLRPGELVGLVGRSGSGKTTLLNVAAGWEVPDAGTITYAGNDARGRVFDWRDVAVLPQKLGLIEELTVRKNVEFPARLEGVLEEQRYVVDDLLEELGLQQLQDRLPRETSVGEQQRAALARALVLSPRLVLVDEPSGHQDAGWADKVFGALRHAARRGTCCLVATHNQEVTDHLDRVLTMSDGRLVDGESPARATR